MVLFASPHSDWIWYEFQSISTWPDSWIFSRFSAFGYRLHAKWRTRLLLSLFSNLLSTGSGMGRGPDPTFPVSRIPLFFPRKNILKSLIITEKAHKCKRLVDSFDWYFEFTQFLKASAKRKSFLYLSVKRAHFWRLIETKYPLTVNQTLQRVFGSKGDTT